MRYFLFDVITLNIKLNFLTLLIRNTLKKYFEFRYHFDFLNLLDLLIINYIKNIINFN
jgi:hypothetical protein